MTHRTFKEIGRHLANGWGWNDGGSLDAIIARMKSEERICCLLAATVDKLRSIEDEIWQLRNQTAGQHPDTPQDVVADGFVRWACKATGNTLVADVDQMSLSTRARKVLRRSGIAMMSEVVESRLQEVRGCGVLTLHEILEWAESVKNQDA